MPFFLHRYIVYDRNANTYCITNRPVVMSVTEVIFDETCQVSFATFCVLLRHGTERFEKSLLISFHCLLLIIKVLYQTTQTIILMQCIGFFLFSTAACIGCLRQSSSGRDPFIKLVKKGGDCFRNTIFKVICLLIYLLTYVFTQWSRVLIEKLIGSAASQEIPRILYKPKVHYRCHN